MFVFGGLSYAFASNYSLPSVSSHLYSYSVTDGSWREETVQSSHATLPAASAAIQLPVFVAGCSAHYDPSGDRLVVLFGSVSSTPTSSSSTSSGASSVLNLVQAMSVANGSWALLAPSASSSASALPALYRHASALSPDASTIYVWGGFKPVATASGTTRLALSSSLYSLSLTSLQWYACVCCTCVEFEIYPKLL